MNKKGFTLIEMLIVIAIIAILVAIIVPVVGNSITKAAAATDAANLRTAKASLSIAVVNGEIEKPSSGNAVPANYGTTPVAKSKDAGTFAYVVNEHGEVTVNFGDGMDIAHFADIADDGEANDTAGVGGGQDAPHAYVDEKGQQNWYGESGNGRCDICQKTRGEGNHT